MIISTKKGTPQEELQKIISGFEAQGLEVTLIRGTDYNVFGLVGDTTKINDKVVAANPWVESVTRVSAPYKKANRLFHAADTIVDVAGVKVGGKENVVVIGGPCSVECEQQAVDIAKAVKAAGGKMLRGGAYKPRTSPYAFQGLGTEGILDLVKAREATGLPIVSELMSEDKIDEFEEYVDLVQIGARNMQNFQLLKAVGKMHKPVLLKRGLANTIEEWIMSAEYIMAGQRERHLLRAGHPHLRALHPQHAGPVGHSHHQGEDPPAHRHRPQPRHRQLALCGGHELGRRGRRGGRPHHRGAHRPRARLERRRPDLKARKIPSGRGQVPRRGPRGGPGPVSGSAPNTQKRKLIPCWQPSIPAPSGAL